MTAPLAKFIDWSIEQVRTRPGFFQSGESYANEASWRLDEAIQFLKGPDFIPAASDPARIEFNPDKLGVHFHFPTPQSCDCAENNVVHGRFYRCAERWEKLPAIILLPGGRIIQSSSGSFSYRFGYPLIARRCNRAGFNAATLQAPYHFQRQRRQLEAVREPDYLRSAEAAAQAVAEIRALTGWLLEKGCPAVALWGVSMGGWHAGLTVCRDARLAAVVMTVPTVHSNPERAEQIIWRSVREEWRRLRTADEKLDMTPFNLTSARPAIPRESILLIGGIHDLVCPMESIEELRQAWGQPDIWRLPHGHNSFMLMPGLTSRILRWLSPRLEKPAIRT
jgi:dienelactone hydrolase